jgi:hypothetical protein
LQTDQFPCKRSHPIGISAAPPKVHPHVAAVVPTQVSKRLTRRLRGPAACSPTQPTSGAE